MLDFYNKRGEKIPFKRIVIPVGALFVPSLVNKAVFEMAKRSSFSRKKENIYNSFLGRVNYIAKGEGTPVLLIHDTFKSGGAWEWDKNIDYLARKHRVYALDLPGYGLSQKPWTVYTAYDYTRLIKDFCRDVIKEKAFGIASGNSAAFLVQAAYLHRDLFHKLIVISPTGVSEKGIMNEKRRRLLSSSVVGTSIYTMAVSKDSLREFLETEVFYNKNNVTREVVGTCHFYAHAGGERGKHAFASHVSGYLKTGILVSFRELDIPILTVWGEKNRFNPVRNVNILEALCPERKFAIFEETRMLPHYENADGFNILAEEFFEE